MISGFGSMGPIVQEVIVIPRVYDQKTCRNLWPGVRDLVRLRGAARVLRAPGLPKPPRRQRYLIPVGRVRCAVEASILIVHPDRKTQRDDASRILGVTGYRVEIADTLEQGMRLLQHVAPMLVVVDGSAATRRRRAAAFFAAARARGAEACMTLLGERASSTRCRRSSSIGAVTNLLVHPMPVLAEELTITAQKLMRGDLFGAEKYLLWGTELRTTR